MNAKECGFRFETQESREYEYGPGKEFETREQALDFVHKTKNQVLSQISLAGCWRLYDSSEIVEEGKCFKLVVKLKTPIINF